MVEANRRGELSRFSRFQGTVPGDWQRVGCWQRSKCYLPRAVDLDSTHLFSVHSFPPAADSGRDGSIKNPG
jgi:hypothetical protein